MIKFDDILDYEIRVSLMKWLPLHLVPRLAAQYYTWKAKRKVANWKKSKGETNV